MKRLAIWCDRIVGVGIAALVLLTPLAIGTVETWSIVALESAIFAIAGFWLAARALSRIEGRRRRRDREDRVGGSPGAAWRPTGLEIPILLFMAVAFFQTVPLPRSIVSVISPRTSSRYERTMPGYARGPASKFEDWLLGSDNAPPATQAAPADGSVRVPLSYAPSTTRWRLMLFTAYVLLFLVAADRYTDRNKFRRLIVWIVFVGVGVAIEGIFQKLAWNGKILWYRNPGTIARPFGPFVNSNHFAGYMELIVPLALGLLLTLLWSRDEVESERDSKPPEPDDRSWVRTAAWLGPREERVDSDRSWTSTSTTAKAVLLGFLLVLSIGSIVLSLSRGGFLATLLTFAIFGPVLVGRNTTGRSRLAMFAGVCAMLVIVLGVVFWLGSSALGERAASLSGMRSEPSFVGRFHTYKRSLLVFRDHPAAGIGLGAFENAFAGYYPPGTFAVWREVHNDYLQLLVEAGIAGVVPALMALFIFFRRHLLPSITDKKRSHRYLALGLCMAIVSMLFHSFVDFNLQVPAVAMLFVLIGGLLVASGRVGLQPEAALKSTLPRQLLMAGGVFFLFLIAGVHATLGERRATAEAVVGEMTSGTITDTDTARLDSAMKLAPNEPGVLASFGDSEILRYDDARGTPNSNVSQGQHLARALSTYDRLVSLAPLWSWGWWGLGQTYARRSALDRLANPIPLEGLLPASEQDLSRTSRLALSAYRVALFLEPNSYQLEDDLAELYENEGLRAEALKAYETSSRLMPLYYLHDFPPAAELSDDVYHAIASGMTQALDEQEAVGAAEIRQGLGELEQQRGDLAAAERQFRAGHGAAPNALLQGVLAADLGEVLKQQGKLSEALQWLETGTKCNAVARQSWVAIGSIRSEQGDHCGARDALQAAVAVQPPETWPEISLAREMALCGDKDGALAKLKYLIGANPPAEAEREVLIDLLRGDGKLDEALEQARALLALAPDNEKYRSLVSGLQRPSVGSQDGGARP